MQKYRIPKKRFKKTTSIKKDAQKLGSCRVEYCLSQSHINEGKEMDKPSLPGDVSDDAASWRQEPEAFVGLF